MKVRRLHIAVDLGAGSGRVIVGGFGADGLTLREVHRFHYGPRPSFGHLRWDMEALFGGIREGLRRAPAIAGELGGTLESVGVDSWGVDYGLIDANGRLVEEPIAYRDSRNDGVMEEVSGRLGRDEIFRRTGIQFLPFNTIYQLVAHVREGIPKEAARLLMIPDLCHHMLGGSITGEPTNASTTQILDVEGRWDATLFERLGLPIALMPELSPAGSKIGTLRPELQSELGMSALPVITPATHDTGSAVLGTPLRQGWAYISSGTWSLVGVERVSAIANAAAARANFTNEAGAFGTIRFLKNVMGLWLLEGCRKDWDEAGTPQDYATLLERVAAPGARGSLIYPDDPRLFNPASMIAAVREVLGDSGQDSSSDPVFIAKTVLDSLALRYASVLDTIESLTGEKILGIHIVGGGSKNAYLNQATADASRRPVLAGPVEATAIGNLMAQAIGSGEFATLSDARAALSVAVAPERFEPRESAVWATARDGYREIEARYRL